VVRQTDGSLWDLRIPGEDEIPDALVAGSANRAVALVGTTLHVFDLVSMADFRGAPVGRTGRWRRSISLEGRLEPDALITGLVFDSFEGRGVVGWLTSKSVLQAVHVDIDRGDGAPVEFWRTEAPVLAGRARLLIDARAAAVFAFASDRYVQWQLPGLGDSGTPLLAGGELAGLSGLPTAIAWGPGRETLLVATDSEALHRYDLSRPGLAPLGPPRSDWGLIEWIGSESLRRVAAFVNADGQLLLASPASGEELFRGEIDGSPDAAALGLSADGTALYSLGDGRYRRWALRQGSPDTGWRSLWQAQRYGAYDEPAHVWHPDGAAIGVLPKYGMTPLLWGTFKAALYGMVVAVPLALGAAIYTGYFLPPRWRNRVKPAVEMLEAFPTVVLGFIAGLWLAPLLADHLVIAVLALPLATLVPLLLAGLHLLAQRLSLRFVRRPPRLPLLVGTYLAACFLLASQAGAIEAALFGGSLPDWLWSALGLRYDQRNAVLIGFAMGLAITPVMFSIVEDAINAVPRRLSDGSLALGATRWQALRRVVLPAASPAVLSALLIGLARGLGETMIVLLATGNAPLMEADPFSGLRSMAANIAAELPEAGAGGVHFRLLFLGALVLFLLTFTLNTVAELFRQRLRYAYAGR
jgi:phosphate transport system permease protein